MFQKLLKKLNSKFKNYKVVIANVIYRIAMRLHRMLRFFISLLIKLAIYFNPRRKLFWDSLEQMNFQDSYLHTVKSFPYDNLANKYNEIADEYKKISDSKDINFTMPVVIPSIELSPKYKCNAILPATYLAIIRNAKVFAQTDLIIVNNKVYYDEIDIKHMNLYAVKSPNIAKITKDKVNIKIPFGYSKRIEKGIHLTKDHSKNYFHWIIEVLPRLSLVNSVSKDVPILVNSNLPPQFYEVLKLFNKDNRQIIKLRANKNYLVKKLYYPSRLSVVNDNYKQPIYHKDAIYSPEGIKFVRDTVLNSLNYNNKKGKRKIFISRSGSDYRQLLNSNEIEELLIDKGFEVVFPEKLSFHSQVKIFSEAEIIIGQSGAGMANFIFAPFDCQVIVMMSDAKENNFQLFNALAIASNISMKFVIGKHMSSGSKYTIHADFRIDIEEFSKYIDEILKSSK